MQNNAIKFTLYEKQILQDTSFLIAKRHAIDKVDALFAQLQQNLMLENAYIQALENALDADLRGAKISKGENYKGLPYVVLDYPKLIIGTDIFLYRSMLWWGNFYSYSLFLQGEPWQKLKHFLQLGDMEHDDDLYISTGERLWEYDYEPGNYKLFKDLTIEEKEEIQQKDFLKLSYKFTTDIAEEQVVENGVSCFLRFMRLLNIQEQ